MADAVDVTEERLDAERVGVARHAAAALREMGSDHCVYCGCEIPAARRRVAPFAVRCIECQEEYERDN